MLYLYYCFYPSARLVTFPYLVIGSTELRKEHACQSSDARGVRSYGSLHNTVPIGDGKKDEGKGRTTTHAEGVVAAAAEWRAH